jgi:hypothetical protein
MTVQNFKNHFGYSDFPYKIPFTAFLAAFLALPKQNKIGTTTFQLHAVLTLSPTALGPIGPRVFKGIQLKA